MVCQMDLLRAVKKNRHPYFEKRNYSGKRSGKSHGCIYADLDCMKCLLMRSMSEMNI